MWKNEFQFSITLYVVRQVMDLHRSIWVILYVERSILFHICSRDTIASQEFLWRYITLFKNELQKIKLKRGLYLKKQELNW
jgi:hypothetical protein